MVIPTRNRWPLLREAVMSALAQRDVAVEVVVVDDASEDETAAGLSAFADHRLRVIRLDSRSGVSGARNVGIEAARGQWVAFLDDDDLWAPTKLRAQLDAATRADAVFAYGGAMVLDEAGNITQRKPAPSPESIARDLIVRNVIPGGCSNLIARTAVVREVGGFDRNISIVADWDLWIRLAQAGDGAACEQTLVAYRRHPDSMVASCAGNVLAEVHYLRNKHRAFGVSVGAELDTRALYRYFARAHRRGNRRLEAAACYLRAMLSGRSPADGGRAIAALLGIGQAAAAPDTVIRPDAHEMWASLPAATNCA